MLKCSIIFMDGEKRLERVAYITNCGKRVVERVVEGLTGPGGPLYEQCKDME